MVSTRRKRNNHKSITRKLNHKNNRDNNAKKAILPKCLMKTCRAKKYQSVYGSVGGSIRSNIALYN
jgi:hypothetical protein